MQGAARFTPQQAADALAANPVQQSFPRPDQKYCPQVLPSRTILGKAPPRNSSHKVHLVPATGQNFAGCFTPASFTIQRPLLANTILPGSLSSTRKNNRANSMPAGQVPTASSRSPRRQPCPMIYFAIRPTVLSSGPLWEKPFPLASHKFDLLPAPGDRLPAVIWWGNHILPRSLPRGDVLLQILQPRPAEKPGKIRPPTQCWAARFTHSK